MRLRNIKNDIYLLCCLYIYSIYSTEIVWELSPITLNLDEPTQDEDLDSEDVKIKENWWDQGVEN